MLAFTIARHLVIDAHRRTKTHLDDSSEQLDDTNLEAMFLSTQNTPEEQVATHEQYAHLWAALQNLASDRREMIVLRYILGWQVKQIAKYLTLDENTVSVYIHRSLDQIRRDWPVI
jgi:RNA polymerase sigma factor (sigma-70 family)